MEKGLDTKNWGRILAFVGLLNLLNWGTSNSSSAHPGSVLEEAAKAALQTNIIQIKSGPYLAAGHYQFHTLWTRDFAWASRGLFLMGRADVVKNHLSQLLSNLRPSDGLVPKTMDSMSPQSRVFRATLDILRGKQIFRPIEDHIEPYFMDENESEAIDSNALVILTALRYLELTGDRAWWDQYQAQLVRAYQFYTAFLSSDGLISQKPHADWQDSVRREGKTFYTNLIYALITEKLEAFPAFQITPQKTQLLREKIREVFFDSEIQVFRSLEKGPQVSLDGNLLALDLDFIKSPEEKLKLYEALKKHPVFMGRAELPGANTYPDYPKEWLSRAPKVSGLFHYHDRLYWSWLMGLAGKVAVQMGDTLTAEKMTTTLSRLIQRDGTIAEIYRANPELSPWESRMYRSERPFSWGAAFILDFAKTLLTLTTRNERTVFPVNK